jgi:hypothetical protein
LCQYGLYINREGHMPKLTKEIIQAAIHGFESQKQRIDVQIAELRAMLTGSPAATTEPKTGKGRRKLSAASLQRMREAQQRRWAKVKAPEVTPESKPKRKLSAAGRKAIVAALKKRWAEKKAASGEPPAKKGGRKKAA